MSWFYYVNLMSILQRPPRILFAYSQEMSRSPTQAAKHWKMIMDSGRRMFELISDIKHMETQRLKRRYLKPDVLVIDDFANTKMSEEDALQIFKVMDYRYDNKSTIIASQLEPAECHKNFGSSQLADSILDRIYSNAYKIILSGDSLRPKKIED